MTIYTFDNYDSLKQAVTQHLNNSEKHIILQGRGSNGKTTLLHELSSLINEKGFSVRNCENIYVDIEREENKKRHRINEAEYTLVFQEFQL